MTTRRRLGWSGLGVVLLAAASLSGIAASSAQGATTSASFKMVSSNACVSTAKANVKIVSNGTTETMTVNVSGLPHSTDFDFFVIQQPGAPFGMSWYQGDIKTTTTGTGSGKFIGRFSIETFVVAPGAAPAPTPFSTGPFPDANSNPPTNPLQMYHLGLWFDSPTAAANAGCPNTVTPFNGTHNAGIQVLHTNNLTNGRGPLSLIH